MNNFCYNFNEYTKIMSKNNTLTSMILQIALIVLMFLVIATLFYIKGQKSDLETYKFTIFKHQNKTEKELMQEKIKTLGIDYFFERNNNFLKYKKEKIEKIKMIKNSKKRNEKMKKFLKEINYNRIFLFEFIWIKEKKKNKKIIAKSMDEILQLNIKN